MGMSRPSCQGEGKPPQTEHTRGNSGILTLYISFYAQESISILLVFMLKELLRHASCDIYHNQLEFPIIILYTSYMPIICQ